MISMNSMGTILFLNFLLFFSLVWNTTSAAKRGRIPAIRGEDTLRRNSRSTDCRFGESTYELGEKWSPNLGPPFGVMYCIKCECEAIQKKRRIVGKTRCRNIKNECPKPTCEEPVLPAGTCCKICPVKDPHNIEALHEDVSFHSTRDVEEELNSRDFAALLTGRTSRRDTKAVSTARLAFVKKNLYYSIYVEGMEPRPRFVQFRNKQGDILEEHRLFANGYQNATGKICGVWRKVPRVYRHLLKDEELYVSLVSDKGQEDSPELSGQVSRYNALLTEMYSSLLLPSPAARNGGGTAIISVSATTGSIHFNFVFNGIFSSDDIKDVVIDIKLEVDKGGEVTTILNEIFRVAKPHPEINTHEFRSVLDNGHMKQLARAKLFLTVSSKHNPELSIRGPIIPRVACELFDTPLAAATSTEVTHPITSAAGMAWIYRTEEGSLAYHILVDGLTSKLTGLTIDNGSNKRKTVEDVTLNFEGGHAIGILSKISAKEIEMLHGEELYVNVATDKYESELRGQLTNRLLGDALQNDEPILLKALGNSVASGLGWLAVDTDCWLHYEISLKGINADQQLRLELEEFPQGIANFQRHRRILHKQFSSQAVEGFMDNLSKMALSRLDSGVSVLRIMSYGDEQVLLEGRVRGVRVPEACLPQVSDNPQLHSNGEFALRDDESDQDNEIPQIVRCYYENKFYEDGEQWTAEHDSCTRCSCRHRRVDCERVLCPPVQCPDTTILPGECCPVCNSTDNMIDPSKGCYFEGERKYYAAGRTWHPYLPPFGFSDCVLCRCDPVTLTVSCNKKQCPPLPCHESDAVRKEPQACCLECNSKTTRSPPDSPDDEGKPWTEEEILAAGGCKVKNELFHNGREWHPRVQPYGEVRCINCNCKDGLVKCKKRKCTKKSCAADNEECCPKCNKKSGRKRGSRLRRRHRLLYTE